ncbi:MAG: hypothetical protein NTW30_00010, partial [Candidatus Aenigmarchaeota archaeon]|nr:hypothetical protein [Candidatus Aenigmarchaeota archaeon]
PSGNNHNVVIVGYKDTGDPQTSYWIAKNSWGIGWTNPPAEPPPKDGYFYIGFGQCNIYFSPYIGDVSTPGVCKIKYGGTCTSDPDCNFVAACHCQTPGGPTNGCCNYPSADCCTSDRPKCCGMTSRTDDGCTSNNDCYTGWFCNQGRGKKCCMDPWFYTTYCGSCTGTVGLKTYVTSRYPPFPTRESTYATVGDNVTFKNYINSFVGDCSNIKVSIKGDSCSGQQVCSCNLSPNFESSGKYGCSCKIKVPLITCPESNPDCYTDYYGHITSTLSYSSCVDFDGDGYETNEQAKVTLTVDVRIVPMSLLDSIVQFFNNLFGIKG